MKKHKQLIAFFITLVLTMLFELAGLWQGVVIGGFGGGLLLTNAGRGFVVGFLGAMAGWGILLVYEMIFWRSPELMAITAQIMQLPSYLLFMGAMFIGGVLGGLGGLNGVLWKYLLIKQKNI